jgi:hypothetical protein
VAISTGTSASAIPVQLSSLGSTAARIIASQFHASASSVHIGMTSPRGQHAIRVGQPHGASGGVALLHTKPYEGCPVGFLYTWGAPDFRFRAKPLRNDASILWYGFCIQGQSLVRKEFSMPIFLLATTVLFGFAGASNAASIAFSSSGHPVDEPYSAAYQRSR